MDFTPDYSAVKHLDDTVRMSSRSGAAFIAFSDIILNRSGVVYGASMQSDFSVHHCRAINKNQRDSMKKAKYVQSNTVNIYPKVAQDLNDGKEVLFSGTPCQVAGLRSYLSEYYGAAEPPVRCGESHLSGLTEPPHFVY